MLTLAERLRRRKTLVAIALGGILLVAALLSAWVLLVPKGKGEMVVDDGPTFYQALSAVNASTASLEGGPWSMFGVWGIATTVLLSSTSVGWPMINQSVNACGAQFNGLTLWNGSIPLFTGTFNSGTAPFWQFAFYSNASQSVEIATDVLGVTYAYPPMAYSSACAVGTSLSSSPWNWAKAFVPFPANTPELAASAWNAGGQEWSSANPSSFEAYVFGFSYWGSANPIGLIVKLSRCGLVGAAGVQPVAYLIGNSDGSVAEYFNGTQGCGNVASLNPPVVVPYIMNFSMPTITRNSETAWIDLPFGLSSGEFDNTSTTDAGGLTAWMTMFNLTNSSTGRLPTGSPGCPTWVGSLTSCGGNASGWYAVLTSASGEWLDSYGSTAHGPAWLVPNVAFVARQHLVVVVPSTWNIIGDVVSMNSTVADAPASGPGVL